MFELLVPNTYSKILVSLNNVLAYQNRFFNDFTLELLSLNEKYA